MKHCGRVDPVWGLRSKLSRGVSGLALHYHLLQEEECDKGKNVQGVGNGGKLVRVNAKFWGIRG